MLSDPRLKQAFQQYEKKQEERYSEKIWKQKHLSREAEERILIALRKQSRRLMWKRILVRASEGLAVAAVFCMMAYAVYIAAHETKKPIIAGTGETETATETTTVAETNETTIIETDPFATETEAEFLAFQERLFERYLELNQPKKEEIVVQFQELLSFSYRNLSELKLYYNTYLGHYDRESVIENLATRAYYRPLLLNYLYATAMDTLYEEENCVLSEEIMTLLLAEEPTYQGEYFRKDSVGNTVEVSISQYKADVEEAKRQRDLRIQKELDALRAQIQTEQSSPDFWKNLQPGDSFYLGTYEQDGLEGTRGEPILWYVVVRNETQLLVHSSQALAAMSWTDEKKNSDHYCFAREQFSWKDSNVRKWLNEEFYPTAFTAEEKERIALFEVKNEWGHEVYQHFNDQTLKGVGGGTTEDYCFVLGQPDLIAFTTRVYHNRYEISKLSDAVLAQYPDVSGAFLRETRRDGWTLNVAGFNSEIDLNAVHGVVPAIVIQIPNA